MYPILRGSNTFDLLPHYLKLSLKNLLTLPFLLALTVFFLVLKESRRRNHKGESKKSNTFDKTKH